MSTSSFDGDDHHTWGGEQDDKPPLKLDRTSTRSWFSKTTPRAASCFARRTPNFIFSSRPSMKFAKRTWRPLPIIWRLCTYSSKFRRNNGPAFANGSPTSAQLTRCTIFGSFSPTRHSKILVRRHQKMLAQASMNHSIMRKTKSSVPVGHELIPEGLKHIGSRVSTQISSTSWCLLSDWFWFWSFAFAYSSVYSRISLFSRMGQLLTPHRPIPRQRTASSDCVFGEFLLCRPPEEPIRFHALPLCLVPRTLPTWPPATTHFVQSSNPRMFVSWPLRSPNKHSRPKWQVQSEVDSFIVHCCLHGD